MENSNRAEYEIPLEHGIVDRIDTYETDDKLYVKVIDYKSSEKVLTLQKLIMEFKCSY